MVVKAMPHTPDPDNPYMLIGSPVRGLISPDTVSKVLDQEILESLADVADVPKDSRPPSGKDENRREFFKQRILKIVERWLHEATALAVREIASELQSLRRVVASFLRNSTESNLSIAIRQYCELSGEAKSELCYAKIILPSDEQLHVGDYNAFLNLYGLIPVRTHQLRWRSVNRYAGSGKSELSNAHRPRSVRVEQLVLPLAIAYLIIRDIHPPPG